MLNLVKRLKKVTKYIEPNLIFIGLVGALGFPSYYIVWKYLFPQPYENLALRVVGMVLFIPIAFFRFLPSKFKGSFHWYFLVSTTYAMPFFFSFMLIKNDFSFIWQMSAIASIFLLIIMAYDWLLIIIMTISGFLFAALTISVLGEKINFNEVQIEVVPVYLFSLFGGLLFNYRNELSNAARLMIMKSMAGSISHELRNPINAINFAAAELKSTIAKVENVEARKEIMYLDSVIASSVQQANNIINIILADLSEKKIVESDFSVLQASKIIPEIVKNFAFNSENERQKVKILIRDEFDENPNPNILFKAVPDRLTFIIYNLLKNALFYLNQYPNSIITIGSEIRQIGRDKWSAIYVHDTGPGISKKNMSRLFGDFFTSEKKGGTGLGLTFCKRNMELFGGKIICESQSKSDFNSEDLQSWAKFSLLFPTLCEDELKKVRRQEQENAKSQISLQVQNQEQNHWQNQGQNQQIKSQNSEKAVAEVAEVAKKFKILIVDDEKVNLMVGRAKIQKFLPNIECDIADSGEMAIKMTKENDYHLILMDIQMPNISGIEAAKTIRTFLPNIPVVAYTSLDFDQFTQELSMFQASKIQQSKSQLANLDDFSDYIQKPGELAFFCRNLSKWIPSYKDNFNYLEEAEIESFATLKGKRVLLADDQEINRVLAKRILEKLEVKVLEAINGKELLELYQASLNENDVAEKISDFDAIITDINMPIINGDEVAKKIREIEKQNQIQYQKRIPIIALTGDEALEDIYRFFYCQIDDYFIKGSDPNLLPKLLAIRFSRSSHMNHGN